LIVVFNMLVLLPISAQTMMNIHKTNHTVMSIELDKINNMQIDVSKELLKLSYNQLNTNVTLSTIDSITFSEESLKQVRKKYSNPVSTWSLPDPTVIRAEDGYYYLYATEDVRNMPIMRSKDLMDWCQVSTVFTAATRPDFEPRGGLWAPDINYINGKYVIYYSMSVWGGQMTCGIGVAEAEQPQGPFKNAKMLFRSFGEGGIDVQNSIDPCYIEENGRKYLFWGSFNGIYGIELSEDGLSLKPGAEKVRVAGDWFEASYIYKKNDYYYLFASIGSCCNGTASTYETVVGRSENLFGPYVNHLGERMLDNKFKYFIQKNSNFVGVGHNSEIVEDDDGNEWVLYHGYDLKNPKGRRLFLDEVHWSRDNWPYITGGTPSTTADGPVID